LIEKTTAVLNLIQSAVVIIGGVFLAWQVYLQRQQTKSQLEQTKLLVKQSDTANYLALMDAHNAITEREIANPKLLALYSNVEFPDIKNVADWNRLCDEQKCLYLHLGTLLSVQERSYVFHLSKGLSKRDAAAELTALKEIVPLPIFKNTWSYLQTFYRDDFVRAVAEMVKGDKASTDAQSR